MGIGEKPLCADEFAAWGGRPLAGGGRLLGAAGGVRRTKRDFGDLGDFATRTGVLRIGFGLCDAIKDAVDEVGTLRRGFAGLERLGGFW